MPKILTTAQRTRKQQRNRARRLSRKHKKTNRSRSFSRSRSPSRSPLPPYSNNPYPPQSAYNLLYTLPTKQSLVWAARYQR